MAPRSTIARDAGLALISRINRWLIAGAVGACAVVSVAAANSFHGHTSTPQAAPSQSSSPPAASSSDGSGSTSDGGSGLQQPAQAPAPAPAAPGPVVSGGS